MRVGWRRVLRDPHVRGGTVTAGAAHAAPMLVSPPSRARPPRKPRPSFMLARCLVAWLRTGVARPVPPDQADERTRIRVRSVERPPSTLAGLLDQCRSVPTAVSGAVCAWADVVHALAAARCGQGSDGTPVRCCGTLDMAAFTRLAGGGAPEVSNARDQAVPRQRVTVFASMSEISSSTSTSSPQPWTCGHPPAVAAATRSVVAPPRERRHADLGDHLAVAFVLWSVRVRVLPRPPGSVRGSQASSSRESSRSTLFIISSSNERSRGMSAEFGRLVGPDRAVRRRITTRSEPQDAVTSGVGACDGPPMTDAPGRCCQAVAPRYWRCLRSPSWRSRGGWRRLTRVRKTRELTSRRGSRPTVLASATVTAYAGCDFPLRRTCPAHTPALRRPLATC
jgi:hypothetical protein